VIHEEVLARRVDRPGAARVRLVAPVRQAVAVGQRLQLALGRLLVAAHCAEHAVVHALREEQFEHELARCDDARALGGDDHLVADREGTRGLEPALLLDLDQAHATAAPRLHGRMVTQCRDIDARSLRGFKYCLSWLTLDSLSVDGKVDDRHRLEAVSFQAVTAARVASSATGRGIFM